MRPAGAIRLTIASSLVIFLTLFLSADEIRQWRLANSHVEFTPAAQVNTSLLAVANVWMGSPAVYKPPAIANTKIVYFDVTGATQADLAESFRRADICKRFGPCAVDPGNPNPGVALGLEGEYSASSYCYSSRTWAPPWRYRIILPRWNPPTDGTIRSDVVVAWNALAKAIYVHEATHVSIAKADIQKLIAKSRSMPTCLAAFAFWDNKHTFDKLDADQNAFHARLRADCRPEIGCVPYGWMGWYW